MILLRKTHKGFIIQIKCILSAIGAYKNLFKSGNFEIGRNTTRELGTAAVHGNTYGEYYR